LPAGLRRASASCLNTPQVWGLQRSGTNLMETVIQKTFSQYTPWLVRLASHIEAVGPAAVPLCRGVEEHCVVMARHGVLKHTPVWKHFHIQATTWPVAVITRKVKIKPGAHPLDVQHVSDLEAIIDEWGGGIFKSAVIRTHMALQLRPDVSPLTVAVETVLQCRPPAGSH
jgi:hypothetical protein